MSLGNLVDPYTLRARVYPGLLALVPMLTTVLALVPGQLSVLSTLMSVLLSAGTLYLMSHLVRRVGRARESELWRSWGGKPTTVALRFRTADEGSSRDLIRSRISRIAADVSLPTADEERRNPVDADRRYEAAVSVLRERTRDVQKFPIVCAENASYGFRRNTWAIRRFGVLITAGATIGGAIKLRRLADPSFDANPVLWFSLGLDLSFLMFWIFIPTRDWVREASDAYTQALFAAAGAISDSGGDFRREPEKGDDTQGRGA